MLTVVYSRKDQHYLSEELLEELPKEKLADLNFERLPDLLPERLSDLLSERPAERLADLLDEECLFWKKGKWDTELDEKKTDKSE